MVVGVRGLLPVALMLCSTATVAWASDGEGRRIRLGGVSAGATYNRGAAWWGPYAYGYMPAAWGPAYWRPWGPAWWDPFWYGGWAHPGYWNGFAQGPLTGEVKLTDAPKEAMVYVDGAYAGTAGKLKNMWLEAGAYNLELRDESGRNWQKRIYVLTGKTLALKADLKETSK